MSAPLRVTVWNEYRHELKASHPASTIYPEGMHSAIAQGLREAGYEVRTATLDQPEHGLTDEVLANTDVLTWWGHMAHGEVRDEIVEKVHARVLEGMGLIVLHSAHYSKIFRKLMGTSCSLRWREADERERIWVLEPGHPITNGLEPYFEIPQEEMYGEQFDIPAPDELVFISSFAGGEVFRGGCSFFRGAGRIFYFSPGDQEYPVYFHPDVRRVLANAALWASPVAPERGAALASE